MADTDAARIGDVKAGLAAARADINYRGMLPGGDTGQVMTKTGPGNYQVAWQTPSGGGGGGGVSPPFAISDTTGLQAALDGKQASSSELTSLAGVSSTSYGRSLLTSVSAAALKASLGIAVADVSGLQSALDNKQPLDAGLTALGGLATPGLYYLSAEDVWSAVTIGPGLSFASGTLAATGGIGNVVGPTSATNNSVALFDGTTGKFLKDGPLLSAYAALAGATFTGPISATNLSGTNTGDQTITLTGEATGSGTGSFAVTLANASVIGKVLTGYTSGAGTVAATDTILQAIQKLNGNDALKANLASPTFTGTPAAPTASAGTNTTQLATTAFVTTAVAAKANIADTLNTQTGTTYTLVAADNGRVVEFNNASAITVTAPVLTSGFNCLIRQIGAGQVTVATSSTTMRNRQSHTKLAGQWAEASIAYRATNEFVLSGDTAA